MTRKEAQDILFDIGKTIAEKQGLTEIETEEPWDGFWTGLYDSLKRQYGEDFKTVIFHDGRENPVDSGRNKYVEIGYRFSDPRLSVFGRTNEGYQTLASIEIGDTVYDDETGSTCIQASTLSGNHRSGGTKASKCWKHSCGCGRSVAANDRADRRTGGEDL
jgi:hypothetical protein